MSKEDWEAPNHVEHMNSHIGWLALAIWTRMNKQIWRANQLEHQRHSIYIVIFSKLNIHSGIQRYQSIVNGQMVKLLKRSSYDPLNVERCFAHAGPCESTSIDQHTNCSVLILENRPQRHTIN